MATHVNYSTNSPDMAVLLIRRMFTEEPTECVSIDFERSMWPGENQSQNALCIGTTNTTVVFHGPLVCFTARTVLQQAISNKKRPLHAWDSKAESEATHLLGITLVDV